MIAAEGMIFVLINLGYSKKNIAKQNASNQTEVLKPE